MEQFFVYILKCRDNSYYIGHTDNIEKRISEHKLGKTSGYTATRLPVHVVFVESFDTREAALEAERQMKGWTRRKKETLIKLGWPAMQGFCKRDKKNK